MSQRVALLLSMLVLGSGCAKIRATLDKASTAAPSQSSSAAAAPAPAPAPSAAAPVSVPDGYARVRVAGVTRLPHGGDAVLLVEEGRKRAVPIFIGGTEALSIQLRLKKQPFTRPLTHDLLDSSIKKLGGRVESVRVDKIESNVFYGTLVLVNGSGHIELDARPSDAIAIAIGNGVPIHVSRKVIDHAGLDMDGEDIDDLPAPQGERPPPISL
ncbi:MAG: bifunctional nuclease family protein [Polyangiaceae bacterium]|nr:bifunctional nuclease family protein [Polyangiaceae bacterium]MCL4754023.1 bifunctional nuclease family protein [Myxococcales bacterium]